MAIKDIVKGICNITRCKYDVYTKERSDELFFVKENLAYITGTILTSSPTHSIEYPSGFNKDNCVVLSVMLKKTSLSTACWTYNTTHDIISQSNGAYSSRVILYDDYIKIFAKTLVLNTDAVTVGEITDDTDFKIVLMKIS